MKKIISLISLGLLFGFSNSQTDNSLGVDCNPRLNNQEISYFSSMFAASNFNFKNKTIGFASPNILKALGLINVPRFANSLLPIDKKEYFNMLSQNSRHKNISKLFVFTESQKKLSGGFDAVVLLIPQKKEKKITPASINLLSEVFGYRTLNYPDNLQLVGNDNNNALTEEDVIFFNKIYHKRKFDFKGKKIAFINPHLVNEKQAIRTKKEYIEKIKKHLETDFLYPTDDLEILNEREKIESGGYDAMIVYQSKKFYKDRLVQILKESNDRK